MTIQLNLPSDIEAKLTVEAEQFKLTLSDYILQLIINREIEKNPPKTGLDLVNYWQKEGLISSSPEIQDSQTYARQIRQEAEVRQ